MEAALRSRVISEIDPHCEWVGGKELDTLIVDVTGFKKEELRVQIDRSRSLEMSGERFVDGGKRWCHFLKRFQLPEGCDTSMIKVHFDRGILYVLVPHVQAQPQGNAPPAQTTTEPHGHGEPLPESSATIWSSHSHTDTAQRRGPSIWLVAQSLSKHKQVALNIVIAILLVWLVTFANNNPRANQ